MQMMLGPSTTAEEEKALRRAKAAAYADSLTAQIASNKMDKENDEATAAPSESETDIKGREKDVRKAKQAAYAAALDAQIAESASATPERKLLRKSKVEDDVEVVPTSLKDRPW